MPTHEELTIGVVNLERRVAQIEKILSEDGLTADGFDKRIRELEGQENALDAAVLLELRDRDRQARWHATYDALAPVFVGRCIGAATLGDTLEETKQRMEWAIVHGHKLTGWYCDRAHGPLEIVVPAGSTFDADALAKGGKFVSQPGWSQWDAKVEALVKAASVAERTHARYELETLTDAAAVAMLYAISSLRAALKPFETERGE